MNALATCSLCAAITAADHGLRVGEHWHALCTFCRQCVDLHNSLSLLTQTQRRPFEEDYNAHRCSRHKCTLLCNAAHPDAFVCKSSGNLHTCTLEKCSYRVTDTLRGNLVCSLTGRVLSAATHM